MYADDTNLTVASADLSDIETMLNQDLKNISHWLITNKLSLNVAKTEYMLVGSNQKLVDIDSTVNIVIDNTKVKRVKPGKSLVVFLDENLSWGAHI